jgi:hypothetical protein
LIDRGRGIVDCPDLNDANSFIISESIQPVRMRAYMAYENVIAQCGFDLARRDSWRASRRDFHAGFGAYRTANIAPKPGHDPAISSDDAAHSIFAISSAAVTATIFI